jgi:hypothetical protein
MGWLFKGLLLLVSLFLFGAGFWWVSAIIFVYLFFGWRSGRRKGVRTVVVAPQGAEDYGSARVGRARGSRAGPRWRWRYLLGALLLFAASLGLAAHGSFSPLVFGGLGVLCFLWASLSKSRFIPGAGYSPLSESTLLRSALVPFRWMTVAEIKLSSQESARALSVLHDDLLVVAPPSEQPAAYLVVRQAAVGYRGAEARMSERLRKLAGLLANRGVYLMPLDSMEVARRFQPGLDPVRVDLGRDTVLEAVGHYPYDVLSVRPDGGHAKSLGAYLVTRPAREERLAVTVAGRTEPTSASATPSARRAVIPQPRWPFERPPLLWEVVSCLQERFRFSEPDASTMFLNNIHLSRGAPPGSKMTLAEGRAGGERSNGPTLMVESLGGAPVEMTRAQLRTIVKMYG